MSGYQPKVGDRVRVVLEGEVNFVDECGFDLSHGSDIFSTVRPGAVVSVEKVAPPLPTTPGSVIRSHITNEFFHLNAAGTKWISDDGDAYPAQSLDPHAFDAGEVTP